MRNCFVPGCDSYCKSNDCVQRKMFFAPKEMFEKWKQKLANKRELKRNDRICERHFASDQIIEYWENVINGEVHKTKREKPRLISTAIPTLNLPNPNDFNAPVQQKKQVEKIKILQAQIIKRNPSEELKKSSPIKKLKTDLKTEVLLPISSPPKTPKKVHQPVDNEILELFENLYDEIMDVTLPNTLYGINRCPDRQFIVFNKFNVDVMGFSKYLFIDSSLNCQVFVEKNVTRVKLAKENCNTEYISDWLDNIEEQ